MEAVVESRDLSAAQHREKLSFGHDAELGVVLVSRAYFFHLGFREHLQGVFFLVQLALREHDFAEGALAKALEDDVVVDGELLELAGGLGFVRGLRFISFFLNIR